MHQHQTKIGILFKFILASIPALILLYLNTIEVWHYTIDDAYISFRYAKHLGEGYGLLWNKLGTPVEGYTNFMLVLILALLHNCGLDIIISAKVIGISSSVSIICLLIAINRKQYDSYVGGIIISILFSIAPVIALHSVSGLETMFFSFILLSIAFILHKFFLEITSNDSSSDIFGLHQFYINRILICILGLLLCLIPDGQFKIPQLWPGQNPPA